MHKKSLTHIYTLQQSEQKKERDRERKMGFVEAMQRWFYDEINIRHIIYNE